jgi:hypothetical protein
VELDDTAADAVAKVKDLEAELDEARRTLSGAEERLKETAERIEADSDVLATEASGLMEQAREERAQVGQDGEEARQAVDQLTEKVQAAKVEAHRELDKSVADLGILQERVGALHEQLGALFDQTEAAARRIEQLATQAESEIDPVLDAARDLLQVSIVGHYESLQQEAEDWAQNIKGYTAELWEPVLQAMTDTWEDTLRTGVSAAIEAGVKAAGENARAVTTEVAEQSRARHAEALDEVSALGRRLQDALQKLSTQVEQATAQLTRDDEAALDEMDEAVKGLEQMAEALVRVKDLLASYSFVSM